MTPTLLHIRASDLAAFRTYLEEYFHEVAPDTDLSADLVANCALTAQDHDCFWLILNAERIGFAIVRETAPATLQLREFTIFPSYRHKGLGRLAAHALFTSHPGQWSLGVADTPHAADFWRATLKDLPGASALCKRAPDLPTQSHKLTFILSGDADAA